MTEIEAIADYLQQLVQTAKDQRANGINLVPAVKLRFPEFTPHHFNSISLRDFILKYVPGIHVIAQNGPDVVYGVRPPTSLPQQPDGPAQQVGEPQESPTQTQELSGSPEGEGTSEAQTMPTIRGDHHAAGRLPMKIWFAFSNTASPEVPIANITTGQLSTIRRGEQAPGNHWKVIDPITREDHVRIARSFLDQVPQVHRSTVEALIGGPGTWWKDHYKVLTSLGLAAQWKQFHNAAVQEQFSARLVAEGVPGITHNTGELRDTARGNRQPFISTGSKTNALRAAAHRLVAGMSSSELRRLPLTLGDVLDIIEEQ